MSSKRRTWGYLWKAILDHLTELGEDDNMIAVAKVILGKKTAGAAAKPGPKKKPKKPKGKGKGDGKGKKDRPKWKLEDVHLETPDLEPTSKKVRNGDDSDAEDLDVAFRDDVLNASAKLSQDEIDARSRQNAQND